MRSALLTRRKLEKRRAIMDKEAFMKFRLFLLSRCEELTRESKALYGTHHEIEFLRTHGRILELNVIITEFLAQSYKRFNKYLNEEFNETEIEGIEFKPSKILKVVEPREYEAIFQNWLDNSIDNEDFELTER